MLWNVLENNDNRKHAIKRKTDNKYTPEASSADNQLTDVFTLSYHYDSHFNSHDVRKSNYYFLTNRKLNCFKRGLKGADHCVLLKSSS